MDVFPLIEALLKALDVSFPLALNREGQVKLNTYLRSLAGKCFSRLFCFLLTSCLFLPQNIFRIAGTLQYAFILIVYLI